MSWALNLLCQVLLIPSQAVLAAIGRMMRSSNRLQPVWPLPPFPVASLSMLDPGPSFLVALGYPRLSCSFSLDATLYFVESKATEPWLLCWDSLRMSL